MPKELPIDKPQGEGASPPLAKPGHPGWILFAFGAVVLLLLLLQNSRLFRQLILGVTAWAQDLMGAHPLLGLVVFVAFSALSALLAFASSVVLVPAANLEWGKPLTFFLLWLGWMLGALVAYGIGRLARPLLMRFGYREKLEKYQQYVSSRMRFWAVLLFCIAVPSEIPGYLFGSIHFSLAKFLAAIGIAEAVYALGAVIAGEGLVFAEPRLLLIGAGTLAVIAAGAGLLLRKLKKKKADKF